MKSSCVKYMLFALSISVLCTDAQALSSKNKAALKSGALGTFSTAIALGTGALAWSRLNESKDMYALNHNNDIAEAAGTNSLLLGALVGCIAAKSAYNALFYFKHMKQVLSKQNIEKSV